MELWRLKNDLDLADFWGILVSYPENEELVRQAEGVLLKRIQASPELRAMS